MSQTWSWCPALLVTGKAPGVRAGHAMAVDGMAAMVFGGASEDGYFHQVTRQSLWHWPNPTFSFPRLSLPLGYSFDSFRQRFPGNS